MKTAILGVVALLLTASTAFADVQLTMQNGRVTLVAKEATVRQILAEWAKVGHAKIVNMERVPGGPISLELINVPEAQALDVLLRSLSGYITAPRPAETSAANLSLYDRIIIMPTLAAARPASSAPAAPVFQPAPQFNTQQPDDGDDDRPAPPPAGAPSQRGPVFNTFPQPQVVNPQAPQMGQPGVPGGMPQQAPAPAAPTSSPTPVAPYGGVAVPGMVAPPPPVPPGQQPGQPIRRPGGPGGL